MSIAQGETTPNGQSTSAIGKPLPKWRMDPLELGKLTPEQSKETLVNEPTTVYPAETQPINTPKIDGDESEFAEHKPGYGPEFPADCLPDVLRDLADNVAAATKTPPVISYAAGLSSVAASLGSNLMLETNPGECVAGNLFLIPIVDSGIGKSRASKPMLKSLYDIHDAKQEEWKKDCNDLQADLDEIEQDIIDCKKEMSKEQNPQKREAIKEDLSKLYEDKKEAEKAMIKPELYTGNTTEAKLATLLRDNDEVMNAISVEAGSAVQILAGKYSSGDKGAIKTEDTLLLSSYCQERYKNDRATTECVDLRNPTVNLLWMIQPRYIPSLFGNLSLASGGFLARCLTFNSHAEPEELTGDEPEVSSDLMVRFRDQVSKLFAVFRFGGLKVVQPSQGARRLMREYYNECVQLRRGELRDIQQFPARWTENAWKIALVLHALHTGLEAHTIELAEGTAEDAIQITKWFSIEFL